MRGRFVSFQNASRARARGAHAWRAAMNPFDALRAARAEGKESVKPPMAQRALSKFLELPTVPIGSFVSSPTSMLHRMDPRIKQAWLAALLVLPAGGDVSDKLMTCAALTAAKRRRRACSSAA